MWKSFRKIRSVRVSFVLLVLCLNSCVSEIKSSSSLESQAASDFLVDLESIDWIHGSANCESLLSSANYQEWQKIRYQSQAYIFRQNKCSHYEGPFVYLFIGQEKALLIDSGATESGGHKLRELVREITDLPILLAHTHGHGDHRLGDGAFASRESMSVVGVGSSAVQDFFGFTNWPREPATLDLGGREIAILPIPGHNDDDLAFYDARSQLVVTGDTLYPGRLYVRDWLEFRRSISRLSDWLLDKPVAHVMGTHIEMSAVDNEDYPIGSTFQPNEHRLPLSREDIVLLRDQMNALDAPERVPMGSFIIWPI